LKNKEVGLDKSRKSACPFHSGGFEEGESLMSYFSSVAGDSVVFSYDFLISLAFFG
jgi:hypothetical protein